jgi:hypothetical protein
MNASGSGLSSQPNAVETEAFGQARIVAAVRARLDDLMPEPLADVLERQEQQRGHVAQQLRGMNTQEESQ